MINRSKSIGSSGSAPAGWTSAKRDVSWVVMADPEDNKFCVLRALSDDQKATRLWAADGLSATYACLVSPRARLMPYLLLGLLTLGSGLGIGLGLSGAPSATTFTLFVPAPHKAANAILEFSGVPVPVGTTCHKSKQVAGGTWFVCYTPAVRGG